MKFRLKGKKKRYFLCLFQKTSFWSKKAPLVRSDPKKLRLSVPIQKSEAFLDQNEVCPKSKASPKKLRFFGTERNRFYFFKCVLYFFSFPFQKEVFWAKALLFGLKQSLFQKN